MEFLFLLASVVFGYSGGPWWTVIITSALLTLSGSQQDHMLALRFARLGSARVFGMAIAQSIASNTLFAALAFGLGRAIASVMPA